MRVTAGLLLTVALLIPGAARAQTGIPGYNDPFGSRPGFPGAPGVSAGPRTPYLPGLPPQVNEMLRDQDVRGTSFGSGGFRRPGPGLPYMSGVVGDPYIPGVPTLGGRFVRPVGAPSAPGQADPYNPTARLGDPNWWNSIHDATVPAAPNVPQFTPPRIDAKVFDDYKRNLTPPPAPSLPGGCSGWVVGIALGALAAAVRAAAGGRRRSSGDPK